MRNNSKKNHIVKENISYLGNATSLLILNQESSVAYIQSVVYSQLTQYYTIDQPLEVVSFISKNPALVKILIELRKAILLYFGLEHNELRIEYHNLDEDWQVLFVDIASNLDLETVKQRSDLLIKWLAENHSKNFKLINIKNSLIS